MDKRSISGRTIAGLDAARAFAAFYVVAYHLALDRDWLHGIGTLLRFGQEAVMIFFVLSGFVVFLNENERALQPRGYYLRRLRRIYPPLLVAMAVSTLIAIDNGDFIAKFRASDFFGTLASLQDLLSRNEGGIAGPYLGNYPLWSLSYEVLFYIAFPAILLGWRKSDKIANFLIGAICCTSYIADYFYPSHFLLVTAYFLIWWAGAMAANAYLNGKNDILGLWGTYAWLICLCIISAIIVAIHGYDGMWRYPGLQMRHFFAAALIILVCFNRFGAKIAGIMKLNAPFFKSSASISYGVYVLHFPIVIQWKRFHQSYAIYLAVLIVLILSYLTERQLVRILPKAPKT